MEDIAANQELKESWVTSDYYGGMQIYICNVMRLIRVIELHNIETSNPALCFGVVYHLCTVAVTQKLHKWSMHQKKNWVKQRGQKPI